MDTERSISIDGKTGEFWEVLPPEPEIVRPNRAQRRSQLFQTQRGYGRATGRAFEADQRLLNRQRDRIRRSSGNPAVQANALQSWIEIENAYRGHV